MTPIGAGPGLHFGEAYPIALVFGALALMAAVGALSHQHDRAFSASLIYLGLGAAAALGMELLGVAWLDPIADSAVYERAAELAVIVALFGTGLKIERSLHPRAWTTVARLLLIAMPLTIIGLAALGHALLGLSLGAAIVLGAALAPTDPVLAGDVGVGPPGDEDEHEPNFAITGEAGLNDGAAFPFVYLGLLVAGSRPDGWLTDWLLADLLYKLVVGIAIGAIVGYGFGALMVRLQHRDLLAAKLEGWIAIAAVLLLYGLAELLSGYGFLAAFAGGLAFRRYEFGHEHNRSLHDGAEMVEKFAELALILLLGATLSIGGLRLAGWHGLLLAAALVLLIRPLSVAVALIGSRMPRGERRFVAWFGVRGIGSLYYVSTAIGLGVLPAGEAEHVFWLVTACISVSIIAHGVSAAPLSRRWLEPEREPEQTPAGHPHA